METKQPIMKVGRDVWDKINMPESEFQHRVRNIKEEMTKDGIDVLLVYGGGLNKYGDPCYVSNFVSRGSIVAIPSKGEPALIFQGTSRDLPRIERNTWIGDLRPCGDISAGCVEYLETGNLVPSTVGLVGLKQLMMYKQWQSLYDKALKRCKTVDSNVIRNMRMVKSARECDQVRRASRILNSALQSLTAIRFTDMNEQAIEAVIHRETLLQGAEDVRVMVARAENWAFRPAENVRIMSGDVATVYLALEYERYWSEGIRTFVAETSSLLQADVPGFRGMYERMISFVRPGITCSELYRGIVNELQSRNVEYVLEHGLGQGIGLSLQEFPVLTENDATELEEGMCLTLRVAVKGTKVGTIMMGDTLCLSGGGTEVLSTL